jgi:membrane protease YdiL (CAAX protease family)
MNNKIKGYYLLNILPYDAEKEVLFRLPLIQEKKYKKIKINIKKDQEIKLLKEVILNILDNIQKYKDNFLMNVFFLFSYLFIALLFILIIFISNYYNAFTIIKKLVNSGAGHLFLLVILIWHLEKILRINLFNELAVKEIKPVEIFSIFTSVIILSGLLFYGNLQNNEVPFIKTDDYMLLSIILFPTAVPLVEELFFRRYIYRYLRIHFDPVTAMFITAMLFIAVHNMFNLVIVFIVLISSLVLTILYEITGKLIFPIIVHGLSNLVIIFCKLCLQNI